jgi:hypothetical protein
MYIQINKILNTKDGGTVAADSALSAGVYFAHNELVMNIDLFLYREYDFIGEGKRQVKGCVEIPNSITETYLITDTLDTAFVYQKVTDYLLANGFIASDLTTVP